MTWKIAYNKHISSCYNLLTFLRWLAKNSSLWRKVSIGEWTTQWKLNGILSKTYFYLKKELTLRNKLRNFLAFQSLLLQDTQSTVGSIMFCFCFCFPICLVVATSLHFYCHVFMTWMKGLFQSTHTVFFEIAEWLPACSIVHHIWQFIINDSFRWNWFWRENIRIARCNWLHI